MRIIGLIGSREWIGTMRSVQHVPLLCCRLALFLLLTVATWAQALPVPESIVQAINPAGSRADFRLRLLLFSEVTGSFTAIRGALRRSSDAQIEVCAEVSVNSVRVRNPQDRETLLGPLFFDAQRYPTMVFRSRPISAAVLESGGRLPGRLRLHGRSRHVEFSVQPAHCDAQECKLRVTGSVQRSEFGMRARRAFLGDQVKLELRLSTCAAGDHSCALAPDCFGNTPIRP